jgi:hypothetical protein
MQASSFWKKGSDKKGLAALDKPLSLQTITADDPATRVSNYKDQKLNQSQMMFRIAF